MSEISHIQPSYHQERATHIESQQEVREPKKQPTTSSGEVNPDNDIGSTGVTPPLPEIDGRIDFFA